MSISESGDVRELPIICYICEVPTISEICGQARVHDSDIGWEEETLLSLVKCRRCGDVMLFKQERALYPKGDPFGWSQPERLFPWQESVLSLEIPSQLRAEHQQARKCLTVNAYTATVVMVRRILEGACMEHGIQERTLVLALQKMEERQIIDGQLIEWSGALRVLGNEAAHYTGKAVTREDAEDAIALAEAFLDYIYVFSNKFKAFVARRSSENKQAIAVDELSSPAAMSNNGRAGI
ncbi:DUF4145 domain-containing protein [Micromonospora vinacea]|uniref:DUF4145 domain-containing protein n=1 Tax=Micromonospora vinacea TaxID=709878 RepID=UPI003450618B